MPSSNRDDQYFATKPAEDVAGIMLERGKSFYKVMEANSYLDKLRNSWKFYHGAFTSDLGFGHSINFTGEQGELVNLPVNHFRNLAQHIYVMITANRPVMEARAVNTDYKSLAQTYLANGILDYYMREKHLEDALKRAVEMAIVMGSGYIKLEWNATAGEEYDYNEETQQMEYEGELEFSTLTPFDVVVDGTKESWNNDWILTRSFKNRFDLMAKYPEFAEQIRALPTKMDSSVYRLAIFSNDDTDDVPVYEFYHKKTESMPDGRYILFLSDEVVLLDAHMPYRVLPVFRIVPSEILGTPYGYTPMFDIFPIQEGINSLYSTIMTNQNAFGVQNLFVHHNADIQINSLQGGMNIIKGNEAPVPLNLTQTPAEVFKFLEMLIQAAETISGVNSVARGNPEASLKSGTALALVQSMALQFISGLQQSYVKLVEDVGTAVIQILKDFATTPKVVALVGKNNRPLLKEFTGENISAINRVVVDIGNPLSRTIAGRVQMAEQMLQMNLIKTPQQYFQVMNTGRMESLYEGEMSELLLIKSENEQLLEGKPATVSPFDQHKMHINEHKAILADPDLRKDAELVKIALDHIEAHVNALRNTDPAVLSLIGEQPLPPLPNPEMMGMQQGAPIQEPPMPITPLKHSPNAKVLSNVSGQTQSRAHEQIQGPGLKNQSLPGMPKPPKPFQHLPTNPNDLIPK